MYMQKVGPISRGMLGGSLATQQSPGQLSGSPCGGVMCALNLVVVLVEGCFAGSACVFVCNCVHDCLSVGG